MTGSTSAFWSLVATGLRGLRSRLLLTLGSVLLAAISVAAAVVGPMYQSGAASSYVVTKLRAAPNSLTGLVFDYRPPRSSPVGYAQALADARRLADNELNDEFGPATVALWTHHRPSTRLGGVATLLAATGGCSHVRLEGRCPAAPGEALILRHDSDFTGVRIGDRIDVSGVRVHLRVVGIYAPRDQDEDFWFDLANLASVPASPSLTAPTPYSPAPLLVSLRTFDEVSPASWFVTASRRLMVPPSTTLADLQRAARAVAAAGGTSERGRPTIADLTPELGNQLAAVALEAQQRSSTARSTVAPAVVSVVLVALVLLLRMLAAAMEGRRSELALASLRGYSRRQMWLLGLLEPALMIVIATPIGLGAGVLGVRLLARTWLVAGLPIPLGAASVLALLAVVLATAVVAGLVVRDALGETLSMQIAGVRRPGRSGRWGVLFRLVIVAAAATVLAATLVASQRSSPDATDLALPILLAVATGLVTTLAAQAVARSWASWTAGRRGIFGYVASRTISRRREGTLVVLPLTAALAISIFAAGVFASAAHWRASDAATIVGAEASYVTELSLGQAVALTHRVDPDGQWLMAVGSEFDGSNQLLVVDAPRLSRVGLWPNSWTPGMSGAEIQSALSTHGPAVTLTGRDVSMTIDNHVMAEYPTLTVELSMTTAQGLSSNVLLGPVGRGVSTVSARLAGCDSGCLIKQMSFGGPAGLTEAMHGTATIRDVRVDGRQVIGFVDGPWRVAQPLLNTIAAVAGPPRVGSRGLSIDFEADSSASFAAATPADVPLVRPIVIGRTAQPANAVRHGDVLRLRTSAYRSLDVRPVAEAESMPVLGPVGMMIDFTMLTRDVVIIDPSTTVSILARSDAPSSVVAALADNGISNPETLTTTRDVLDNDAFALALNLYLVVTVIVVLLALAGLGASLAVQLPARRRDAASLRVVGLRRRSIVSAVVAEFVVVLGAAAVAGIAAGSVSQYVVVRTVTLGYADSQHTPRLLPTLDVSGVATLLVVVTGGLLAVAIMMAGLTVRGARTAGLREDA